VVILNVSMVIAKERKRVGLMNIQKIYLCGNDFKRWWMKVWIYKV